MPRLIWIMFARPLSWLLQSLLVLTASAIPLGANRSPSLASLRLTLSSALSHRLLTILFKPEDWWLNDRRPSQTRPHSQPLWFSVQDGGQSA